MERNPEKKKELEKEYKMQLDSIKRKAKMLKLSESDVKAIMFAEGKNPKTMLDIFKHVMDNDMDYREAKKYAEEKLKDADVEPLTKSDVEEIFKAIKAKSDKTEQKMSEMPFVQFKF